MSLQVDLDVSLGALVVEEGLTLMTRVASFTVAIGERCDNVTVSYACHGVNVTVFTAAVTQLCRSSCGNKWPTCSYSQGESHMS